MVRCVDIDWSTTPEGSRPVVREKHSKFPGQMKVDIEMRTNDMMPE